MRSDGALIDAPHSQPFTVLATLGAVSFVTPVVRAALVFAAIDPGQMPIWVGAVMTSAYIVVRGSYEIHKIIVNWNVDLPPVPDLKPEKPESYRPRKPPGRNHD